MEAPIYDIARHRQIFTREMAVATLGEFWYVGTVTTPFDVCMLEDCRASIKEFDTALKFPCDLFVFGAWDGANTPFTRVGGVPFRPRDVRWPMFREPDSADKKPCTFVAQFYFGDSKDITPHAPDDVLLVFFKDQAFSRRDLRFEWWPSNLTNVCTLADMPAQPFPVPALTGYRYRTWDTAVDYTRTAATSFMAQCDVLPGVKIGGLGPVSRNDVLCTLCEIYVRDNTVFPLVNLQEPLSDAESRKRSLDIEDNGIIEIVLDEEGDLRAEVTIA
jgi:hypothetical protein